MYILINIDEMELLAKHPNFATLYELGIIICPDGCSVLPLDMKTLDGFVDGELEMLYIGLTYEAPKSYSRQQLTHILLDYINELPETRLDASEVSAQASYAIKWGIEGYCSFVKGKKEPSHDEGLWENPKTSIDLARENAVASALSEIAFKPDQQRAFRATL